MRITLTTLSEPTLELPERITKEEILVDSSTTQNRSLKLRFKTETQFQPNLQNILVPTLETGSKNRVSTIAKISIEKQPIACIDEDADGDFLVGYTYRNWEGRKPYTIFITLENGERYMAFDIDQGTESFDECVKRIPSFLTVGSQVEVFPRASDCWDRARPITIIKDVATGKEYCVTKFF